MSVAADNLAKREEAARGTGVRTRRGLAARLRLPLMLLVPLALVLIAGYWYLTGGRYASTDDSYIEAGKVTISTDVPGRVADIEVRENQSVNKGQVLFRLDDRPFRIALERAQAQLANARLQVEGLRASYQQKLAELKQSQDTVAYQQREFERQQQLVSSHVVSQSAFDNARHNLDVARQQLAATQQQLANVLASLGGNPDIPTAQHPLVQQAQAQVDQAALDLSHTVVSAPTGGIISQVSKLQVGDYLNAATPAFSLVDTDHVWVDANFKETDLTYMRPGQEATVSVDTYPDKTFQARVDSISAGTGSEFSVLPAQNASGNWVKVVQRIPVRLLIENPDKDHPLRAGMSVTVEVDTGHQRPLLASLQRKFAALFGRSSAGAAQSR